LHRPLGRKALTSRPAVAGFIGRALTIRHGLGRMLAFAALGSATALVACGGSPSATNSPVSSIPTEATQQATSAPTATVAATTTPAPTTSPSSSCFFSAPEQFGATPVTLSFAVSGPTAQSFCTTTQGAKPLSGAPSGTPVCTVTYQGDKVAVYGDPSTARAVCEIL